MFKLFKIEGFTPYILIMFLNALTDLGHKITLQNTIFKTFSGSELIILTALINALILLPFVILFKPAGSISDRYKKTQVIKYSALLAVFITVLITFSYYQGWFYVAFGMTFILAAQSAIYSPAKYGLIKEMVKDEELTKANAIVQTVTIISILLGAVVYSILFETMFLDASTPSQTLQQVAPLGFILIFSSVLEFLMTLRLEKKAKPRYKLNDSDESIIKLIKEDKTIFNSIIALSVFWAVSQVVVAIFGEYLKSSLGEQNTAVAQGLLSLSGVGIITGSIFAGRVSKNYIQKALIPLGAFVMGFSLLFIPLFETIYILGGLIFIFGVGAGMFIVPLNALIQHKSKEEFVGKILAGNNLVQNIFMICALLLTTVVGYLDISSKIIFLLLGFTMILGGILVMKKLVFEVVRFFLKVIINLRYSFFTSYKAELNSYKGGLLLVGNHQSFIDWAILQVAFPRQIRFVMDKSYYDKWYIKPIVKFFNIIPISTRGSKEALKGVTDALNSGEVVCIFAEGHLTQSGHIGEFQRGFEIALKDAKDAKIVPFYLRGLWEGSFSKAPKSTQTNRDISVDFGAYMAKNSTKEDVKKEILNLSVKSWDKYISRLNSIQEMWIDGSKNNFFIADSSGQKFSSKKYQTVTFLMAKKFHKVVKDEKNIGLIMPATIAGSLANMAIFSLGKTVVNLNYTSGKNSLTHAIELAEIKTIITSKQAIEKLKEKGFDLEHVIKDLKVIYLEDIKQQISKKESLLTFLKVLVLPKSILKKLFITKREMDDTAVILFSSGSEGTPKGIELSHKNIVGNIKQIHSLIAPKDDIIMGTLPIFHSLGLTVTLLYPLLQSVPVVYHPDPTDAYNIGKLVQKYKATIIFGTSTFYRLYTRNRKLKAEMFESLRLVVAGAEKLSQDVRKHFGEKFNKTIYEGYGATETTPVATINIPDKKRDDSRKIQQGNKLGTVGLALPGTSVMITVPDSFEKLPTNEAGMILIGGVQVMKGYLKAKEKTTKVLKEIDGVTYYVTGDKGKVDKDGFLTIVDRYSRFAKIGGEMVSLGLVEDGISKLVTEDFNIAVTAVPDEKKGEKIVLLAEGKVDLTKLKDDILSLNLNSLFLPAYHFLVDEIPKLGTGKADFKKIKKLAMELLHL